MLYLLFKYDNDSGAIEPQFYAVLIRTLGLDESFIESQYDQPLWPKLKHTFAEQFRQKTRDEWIRIFKDEDACVFPVLDANEIALTERMPTACTVPSLSNVPNSRNVQFDVGFELPVNQGAEGVLKDAGFTEQESIHIVEYGALPESKI